MNRIGNNLICTGANRELVQAFSEHDVRFVVIGGLAVSWHCHNRQADDMDLLVDPSHENSARINNALSSLHLMGFTNDSFSRPGLQVPLKTIHYAELLTPTDNGPTYSEVAERAVKGNLFDIPVLIASARSLIQMKKLAVVSTDVAREKHVKDIECLMAITQ